MSVLAPRFGFGIGLGKGYGARSQGGGVTPIVLDYPTLYICGASLEGHGVTGQQNQKRFGYTPMSEINWANELDGVRLFDQNASINDAAYPYFSPPSNYAQSGSGWMLKGSGTRPSILEQVASVKAILQTLPVGKRMAYLSGGRNEVGVMPVSEYMGYFDYAVSELLPYLDLGWVPGLWLRHTSVGGVWASGGQARQDVLDINAAMAAYLAGNQKITLVPLIDVMNEPTGDRNPKSGYVQADGTHKTPAGSKASGKVLRAAMIGRLQPQSFGTKTNLASPLTGTSGTLTNATGSVADAYTLGRSGTGPAVSGSKGGDDDVQVISVTRAASQTPPCSGFSFETLAANRVPVSPGGKYRARAIVVIDPTPVPVSLAFFASEFLSTTAVQRVVGRWHMLSGSAETPTNNSNGTGFQPIDASEGLTLWLETPDIPIISSSGSISIGAYIQLTAEQGAAATVTIRIEELEVTSA